MFVSEIVCFSYNFPVQTLFIVQHKYVAILPQSIQTAIVQQQPPRIHINCIALFIEMWATDDTHN